MRKIFGTVAGIVFGIAGFVAPSSAATVVDGSCTSVASSAGCLFSGNINSSGNGNNSYLSAQNAYNLYNDTHASAQPDIFLNILFSTDDAGFGSVVTGTGASGSWHLPTGFAADFFAVKASNNFVLYKLGSPAIDGLWDTFDIPYNQNPHGISHLVFFGTEGGIPGVPEPSTWVMLILGFGLTGAMLRRRRQVASLA